MKKLIGVLLLVVPFIGGTILNMDPNVFTAMLGTLAGLVALTPLITESLNEAIDAHGWFARLLSWLVAIVLCYTSWFLGFTFIGLLWWQVLVAGVLVGLCSNGYFTLPLIQAILAILTGNVLKANRLYGNN